MKIKLMSFSLENGSLKYTKPSKNWLVGVMKKIIPEVLNPACSRPFMKKNSGITVIGPAKKSKNMLTGSLKEKLFKSL